MSIYYGRGEDRSTLHASLPEDATIEEPNSINVCVRRDIENTTAVGRQTGGERGAPEGDPIARPQADQFAAQHDEDTICYREWSCTLGSRNAPEECPIARPQCGNGVLIILALRILSRIADSLKGGRKGVAHVNCPIGGQRRRRSDDIVWRGRRRIAMGYTTEWERRSGGATGSRRRPIVARGQRQRENSRQHTQRNWQLVSESQSLPLCLPSGSPPTRHCPSPFIASTPASRPSLPSRRRRPGSPPFTHLGHSSSLMRAKSKARSEGACFRARRSLYVPSPDVAARSQSLPQYTRNRQGTSHRGQVRTHL